MYDNRNYLNLDEINQRDEQINQRDEQINILLKKMYNGSHLNDEILNIMSKNFSYDISHITDLWKNVIKEKDKKVKEENKNKDKRPLNLSLPSMSWESMENNGSSRGVLPDVFREIPQESTLNFSGKLLWDESEEARQMPIEDTIKGAEVELQFYLP